MAVPTSPFVSADSLYAGLSVIRFTPTAGRVSGVTGATSTLTFLAAHGLAVGDMIKYVSGTGFTGLTASTYYYVVSVPTSTTATISATAGGSAIAVGTSSAGIFDTCIIFEALRVSGTPDQQTYQFRRPDSGGVSRRVRSILTQQDETFTFQFDQAKRLPAIFSGLIGRKSGTATIWFRDPDDATGYAALVSETDFSATLLTEGSVEFGGGTGTLPSFRLESNKQGVITFTKDASV
jgi:hypothetical protein